MPTDQTQSGLDLELVRAEWPVAADGSLYFNTGSCGRKPLRVLRAIEDGWRRLNLNPTLMTFLDSEPFEDARSALATVMGIDSRNILLTQNSTQALHLVLNSLLLEPGDELVTTTHEHGSLNAIARYLVETRGVVVRRLELDPLNGERVYFEQVQSLITDRTRLVQVSEIDCYSGWRPDLSALKAILTERGIPLLVDAAHSLGQGPSAASEHSLYAGSCHKWLGAPNGTGFLVCGQYYSEHLKPVWISDRFYEGNENPLSRFEFQGTGDVVRWLGLKAACDLQLELGLQAIADRQRELVVYLAERLRGLAGAKLRTPLAEGETSGIICATWDSERVPVPHLRDHLWEKFRIWTQPDFSYGDPGHGLRLSCHISIEMSDIERLIDALRATFWSQPFPNA